MNDYIEAKEVRVLFESWLESDYLNESNQTVIHKPDNGAPPRQITGSYANAYLDTNDTDHDGLFDFVEYQIGTDPRKVDTDGDGVPDGKEFIEDSASPSDGKDYLVSKPVTTTKTFDPAKETILTGTVPKPLLADLQDGTFTMTIPANAAAEGTKVVSGGGCRFILHPPFIWSIFSLPRQTAAYLPSHRGCRADRSLRDGKERVETTEKM